MRDYLYIWNDPIDQFIVASGIEFRDIAESMDPRGGLILINPDYDLPDYVERDNATWLAYIHGASVRRLASEEDNACRWGNLCWADYAGDEFPAISDYEVAELLYFEHMKKPLGRIALPSLRNRYLCCSHDDGWYLKLFYPSWDDVARLVGSLHPELDFAELESGPTAFWSDGACVEREERTRDIDAILNRRLP